MKRPSVMFSRPFHSQTTLCDGGATGPLGFTVGTGEGESRRTMRCPTLEEIESRCPTLDEIESPCATEEMDDMDYGCTRRTPAARGC